MKIISFNIEIYDWDIQYIELKNHKRLGKLKKILKAFPAHPEDLISVMKDLKDKGTNGGHHFYDLNKRKTLILLYPCRTETDKFDILCHEKRHAEDRILQHLRIYDIESAGYLAGLIAKKIMN